MENPDETTLDQIKARLGKTPRLIPHTSLDYAAMHSAIDRFQLETQNKEIREWFIYQAPPGLYDMFIEERERMRKEDAKQRQLHNKFTGAVVLAVGGYLLYTLYKIAMIGY